MAQQGSRSLCFFVKRTGDSTAGGDGRLPEVVDLNGVMSLRIRHQLVTTAQGRRPDSLIFEPMADQPVPTVRLTVDDDDAVVRVNGEAIGSTHMLQLRDVVTSAGDPVALHLSMFQRPYVGPVAAEHAGRECAVCNGPIEGPPPAVVLECVACGALLHEHAPGEESTGACLECAKSVTDCPICETRLERREGYVYVPGTAG
jgi:hypothetical protein